MIKTENLINGGLIGLVILLAYLIATSRYQLPQAPKITESESASSKTVIAPETEVETLYVAAVDRFPAFGQRNIFQTIITRPTPKPRPTATPAQPPSISVLTRYWVLLGAFGNKVIIKNKRTRKEFYMKLNESRNESYRGKNYSIKLIKISGYEATFQFEDQTVTKSVY